MSKPLMIDLFTGLHGWGEAAVLEGYDVIAFDIVDMCAELGVERPKGIELVIQDVLTLTGQQFKGKAQVIVASPPCTEPSYRAMPWSRAKALNAIGPPHKFIELFNACFRIAREAEVPLIVENVCGAQRWVGRARWHFGSYYLWGDVPALMPITRRGVMKAGVTHRTSGATSWHGEKGIPHKPTGHWTNAAENVKVPGLDWSGYGKPGYKKEGFNVTAARRFREGVKFSQTGDAWFDGKPRDKMLGEKGPAAYGSRSNSRKAASAEIAKIPLPLAQHIARSFK